MSDPDKPRPKASARRKRIVESVITEPIRPLPPQGSITQQIETTPVRVSSATPAAPTSTRSRPRRGESSTTHASDYSLEVQPITTAAIDRKDKYVVNPRVLEIAGKVAAHGEAQTIKCFGCIEDEAKRQRALDEYEALLKAGETAALSADDLENLETPIKCMYYDPAERGLFKGVRMSDLNYGRCANCMTHGRGCWWPTASLTATASTPSTNLANAGAAVAAPELGHVVDEETNAKRSKRIEGRREREPREEPVDRKPRKGSASASAASVDTAKPRAKARKSASIGASSGVPDPAPSERIQPPVGAFVYPEHEPEHAPRHATPPIPRPVSPPPAQPTPPPIPATADPQPETDAKPAEAVLADADTKEALRQALIFMASYNEDEDGPVAQPAVQERVGEPNGDSATLDNGSGEGGMVQVEQVELVGQVERNGQVDAMQVAELQVDAMQVAEPQADAIPVDGMQVAAVQVAEPQFDVIPVDAMQVDDEPRSNQEQDAGLADDETIAEEQTGVQEQPETHETAQEVTAQPIDTQEQTTHETVEETVQDATTTDAQAEPLVNQNPEEGTAFETQYSFLFASQEEPEVAERGDTAEEEAMNEQSAQDTRPAVATQESEEMIAQELEFVPETQRRDSNISAAAAEATTDAMLVDVEPVSDMPNALSKEPKKLPQAPDDDAEIIVLDNPAAVTSAGRTRTARSTRNKTSANNKRRPPIATDITSTDPATYRLTQKWIDRLPDFPAPRIVIVETSVPLRYDNTNLMSLDIPGVNKVFRKCTGCTLRECECAPLPLTEEQEATPHAQYRQNSVLDAAGCLTCRICGVVCSFTLDPPIYGEFASLPSPRALDEMKLLPEDWDTRSTLDGFEGEDDAHADPTFLQSNKCSGCILRQCLCIALPAGEGRGGGCVKCQECNVACSFGVATPEADGKTVVWADADSTKTGGRALNGVDKKQSKRRILAAASDDEERADEMQVDE